MNTSPNNPLEARLEKASRWEEPVPQLWARALASESAGTQAGRERWARVLRSRWPIGLAAACVIIASLAVVGQFMGPGSMARRRPAMPQAGLAVQSSAPEHSADTDGAIAYRGGRAQWGAGGLPSLPPVDVKVYRGGAAPSDPEPADRVVIRKATMELECADVRATFAKAAMLVSQAGGVGGAGGEYMQESALTGGAVMGEERVPYHATMTLRVGVARLGEVLNALRGLGTVTSESSGGEDVTSQAVDLDARLRNEQRVETELLELMSSRKDAPLKEILELREQISKVRERIEQLTAQRDRLSHLASLATVLVIIREPAASTIAKPATDAVGNYFTDRVANAWHDGLVGLSNSIAWIVGVIIGGAIWWIALAIIIVVLVRLARNPNEKRPRSLAGVENLELTTRNSPSAPAPDRDQPE